MFIAIASLLLLLYNVDMTNGAVGDTVTIANPGGTYGSRFGIRMAPLGESDQDFFVIQSLGGKHLFEVDPGVSATHIGQIDTAQWFSRGCGNVFLGPNSANTMKTFLLDPNLKTTTLVTTITPSSLLASDGVVLGNKDLYNSEFIDDCSKIFVPISSAGTTSGFKIFDVDPATAVMTFNSEHVCSPSICDDGTVANFDAMDGKFGVSGDGTSVFLAREIRNSPVSGANSGGIVHFKYDGSSWSESWLVPEVEVASSFFGKEVQARGKTLFAASTNNLGKIHIYTADLNGDYTFDTIIENPGYSTFGKFLRAYNAMRVCSFATQPTTNGGTLSVWDNIDGVWNNTGNFYAGYSSAQFSSEDGYCGNRFVAGSNSYFDGSNGHVITFETNEAPLPPPACITTPDCTGGKYCKDFQCKTPKVCTLHTDCFGELDAGRLPYCGKNGACKDPIASSCSTPILCDMHAKKYKTQQTSIGSLSQSFSSISNSVVRGSAALSSITKLKNQTTVQKNMDVFVQAEETIELWPALFDNNDEATILANIKQVRCGDAVDYCDVSVQSPSRRLGGLRNLQSNNYIVTIVYDVSDDVFDQINNSTSFDDPDFKNDLILASGVNASDVEISSTGGQLTVSFTLTEESIGNEPVGDDVFDDIATLQNSISAVTNEVITEFSLESSDIETQEVDLCNSRDCNGHGAELCDEDTGVCDCPDGYWGVNCDVETSCENDGVPDGSYCVCEFPHYGLRCQFNRTATCVDACA